MEINPGFLIITLYIIISGNFMAPLLSCKLQTLLSDSMTMRHIIGLLTFIFFVGLANVKQASFTKVIGYSLALYAWFLATTRMDLRFWIPLLIVFAALFLMETYKNTLDDSATDDEKANFENMKSILVNISMIITLIGVLVYAGSKKIEYGKQFSISKFIVGKQVCRQASPSVGIMKALQELVKN